MLSLCPRLGLFQVGAVLRTRAARVVTEFPCVHALRFKHVAMCVCMSGCAHSGPLRCSVSQHHGLVSAAPVAPVPTLRARGAGDVLSRGPSQTGEFTLPSTALSSSPGQFATIDAAAPFSVYSNPPSLPPSNPPTSNPPSELHEEDDLAQATIGHSIAEATPNANTSAAISAVTAGSPDAAVVSTAAVLPDALTVQLGGSAAAATSLAVTSPLPLPSGSTSVATGGQALPPTEVNIARHTHALAATILPPPQQQKVGRFSVKKKQDPTTSDNGSAVTMPGVALHAVPCDVSLCARQIWRLPAGVTTGLVGPPPVSVSSTRRSACDSVQEGCISLHVLVACPSCAHAEMLHRWCC